MKIGLVGLPNVGKSSLFNALTRSSAAASNYPFCTIDPNIGAVGVPDKRLDDLAALFSPPRVIPALVNFVDIAGLVQGAHKGEGLGNRFLGHIREVEAIAQVVRAFTDDDVTHVTGSIDPLRDIEVVGLELIFADLEAASKRLERVVKQVRSGDKGAALELEALEGLVEHLEQGKPARSAPLSAEQHAALGPLFLLSHKPLLYIVNVDEDTSEVPEAVAALARQEGAQVLFLSVRLEAEVAQLSPKEALLFRQELGLGEPGLLQVISASYRLLGLLTFFTAGEKEVRAWTLRRGTKAPAAAGKIHSDMERGFIRAEVITAQELLGAGSYTAAREQGLLRSEGKEYVVADGDVMHIRFNV